MIFPRITATPIINSSYSSETKSDPVSIDYIDAEIDKFEVLLNSDHINVGVEEVDRTIRHDWCDDCLNSFCGNLYDYELLTIKGRSAIRNLPELKKMDAYNIKKLKDERGYHLTFEQLDLLSGCLIKLSARIYSLQTSAIDNENERNLNIDEQRRLKECVSQFIYIFQKQVLNWNSLYQDYFSIYQDDDTVLQCLEILNKFILSDLCNSLERDEINTRKIYIEEMINIRKGYLTLKPSPKMRNADYYKRLCIDQIYDHILFIFPKTEGSNCLYSFNIHGLSPDSLKDHFMDRIIDDISSKPNTISEIIYGSGEHGNRVSRLEPILFDRLREAVVEGRIESFDVGGINPNRLIYDNSITSGSCVVFVI